MILLSGSSNTPLAAAIAASMGVTLAKAELSTFPNGELRVWIQEDVKGKDVALIQSFSDPTDTHIMEFALLSDALVRAGAARIFAVIPWLGYSLQDKVFRTGEPIAAKVVAGIINGLSIDRVLLMSLHNSSIAGFFQMPTSVLSSDGVFVDVVAALEGEKVIVSSDFGGLKSASSFAQKCGLPIANIEKRRDLTTGQVSALSLTGDVSGKCAVIFDDIVNGGSTAVEAAKILQKNGAARIIMCATHGLFAGEAAGKIDESPIDMLYIADTIDCTQKPMHKRTIVSVADVFAKELNNWK